MNTIGKILVILNFIFAVAIGAILVMDVGLRKPWKEAYEALKRENDVLRASTKANYDANKGVTSDFQGTNIDNNKLRQDLAKADADAKDEDARHKAEILRQKEEMSAVETLNKELVATHKRLTQEIDLLNKTLKDRELTIVKQENDYKIIRVQAQEFEGKYRNMLERNQNLLDQLQKQARILAEKDAGVNSEKMQIENPNGPNPPAVAVNGKVEQVEGDLVKISLGTDHGVKTNNTLDIYRLKPEPKYLGMVRIVDANHHTSVARLIPASGQVRVVLREGDLVASKLTK